MVPARRRRCDRVAVGQRSGQSRERDSLDGSRRTRLCGAAGAAAHDRLLQRRRAALRAARRARLSLRCGVQGSQRRLVGLHHGGARDLSRRAVRSGDARCAARRRHAAPPGRLRLSVQQLQVVGFPRRLAARSVRAVSPHRPLDRVSRKSRYAAPRCRIPRPLGRRARSGIPLPLFIRGVLLQRRPAAGGLRVRFRPCARCRNDASGSLADTALRHQRVHRRGERPQSRGPGAQRRRRGTRAARVGRRDRSVARGGGGREFGHRAHQSRDVGRSVVRSR